MIDIFSRGTGEAGIGSFCAVAKCEKSDQPAEPVPIPIIPEILKCDVSIPYGPIFNGPLTFKMKSKFQYNFKVNNLVQTKPCIDIRIS